MSEMPERRFKGVMRTGTQELPPCCIAMMSNEARDVGNPLLSTALCPSSLNRKGNVCLWMLHKGFWGSSPAALGML